MSKPPRIALHHQKKGCKQQQSRRYFCEMLAKGVIASTILASQQAQAHTADLSTPEENWLDFDWVDEARRRPVPVRLYLPNQVPSKQAPLVVFSHGLGGSRNGYSYFGSYLAQHGVASLHLQHVGSDRSLWFGNIFNLVERLTNAAQDEEALARVEDFRFAIDRLGKSHLAQRVDTSRVIAAGHSYGANTTLLVAGARVPRKGALVDTRDHRVHAAILISAPRFYGEGNFQEILASVDVPSLHITATGDDIRLPGFYSGVEDRLDIFTATGSKNKWLAVFNGGSHSMFTDRSTTGGLFLNPQVKMATRSLSLAFIHYILHGDESTLRAWPEQYMDILSEFRTPALSQGPL